MVYLDLEENGRRRTIDLSDGRYVVGRAPDVDLRLDCGDVSRHHALLEVEEDRMWVRDLGSLCGTYVGASRIAENERLPVPPGELLRIAQVQVWNHEASRPRLPRLADLADETTHVTELRRVDMTEISGRRLIPMLRHLFHLFTLAENEYDIEHEACLFVKNWVDVDRVCLFEAEEPGRKPPIRGWWSRDSQDSGELVISEKLVRGVLESGEAIVWTKGHAPASTDFDDSRRRLNIHSAIAVPIVAPPSIRGVLYVDRRRASEDYDHEDVEVLMATANAVATRRAASFGWLETKKAARIQSQMLPDALPDLPGYELDAGLHMCQGVGGDLYDCIRRPDGSCVLVVGDVSGKGLPAALLMGATAFLARALAELDIPPLEIYSRLHRNLMAKHRAEQYVAMFFGILEPESGVLRYVLAGLPYPLVIRRNGEVEELKPTAFPVAMTDLTEPAPREDSVELEVGDLLAVFTDGYPESTPDGDRFLDARISEAINQHQGLPLREIRSNLDRVVDDFVGAAGPTDDRTLLLLRRKSGAGAI